MAAIENGINVLVEKPIALSVRQTKEIDWKFSSDGVKVCVVQIYRFRDPVIRFLRLQEESQIGDLWSINSIWHASSFFAGPRWLWNEEVSGGVLYENGVHVADLHCFLLGPHTRVIGITSTFDRSLSLTIHISALLRHQKRGGFH